METAEEVVLSRRGGIGHILLNRPKVLNAINMGMVSTVAAALADWAFDSEIRAVVIEGAGDRAFCAGGDVVAVSLAGQKQEPLSHEFFQAEYRLNRAIHLFEKPYIAFLDGITMGGGVGLSVHGNHRIVTENTLFAMPETGIGMFPDVGGSHFLPRCPGAVGLYLGLTGSRLKAADLLSIGLADVFIPAASRDHFMTALEAANWGGDAHAVVADVCAKFAGDAGPAPLDAIRADIERHFAKDSVEAILDSLKADDGAFAAESLKFLTGKSPTLLKVTLEQLRRGGAQEFDANMVMEYRMARRALKPGADFHEGVRALLIDKDKSPKWSPATVSDVSESLVAEYFAPQDGGDLVL
ncbi:enoyl-CoA hydratase/isomerase family protein [Rhodospirillaceae bacterium KN72]|uniref:3-hydroxyisobutyryl-CoA hydrolase n=1 Tax=Pacificispira spongiicola TaxID=2729598 RepID=A0A7Y0DZ17_9PROT|nr:enoyl-CoA hydratase/isomerase family protein [Pacificispira spongiicola]NMM44201.1 enoyl-CoA hydratase/isomerase family protein [Pacificispira spongiicola]